MTTLMMEEESKALAATRADLLSRLDAGLALPPEYSAGLSNHLPMALQALHALGASARRMDEFAAAYRESHFEPEAAEDPAYVGLKYRFTRMLAEQGRAETLRRVLPGLLPGVAAAAFHGVIRTAHAVEAGHDGELAAGLAYWAWRWHPLPAPMPALQRLSFEVWTARLISESRGWRSEARLISGRMVAASETALYGELAAGPWPVPDLLRRLSGLALERYLASGNFTVLHMITGLRAVRVLLPWAGQVEGADALLARAFTAAYMAARVVERPRVRMSANWEEVVAAAIAQDDDHVIKLVHACREEAWAYRNPRYLEAAALAALKPSV